MVRHDGGAELRDELIMLADRLREAATVKAAAAGQQAYTTAGTYTFTVPAGVTSICAVCVGAGGGSTYLSTGNFGGSLSYSNNVATTPGESLTVVVGAGGTGTSGASAPGGDSKISRSATTLILAKGGASASSNVGGVSYTGGNAQSPSITGSGGGGAGGYSGNGGGGGADGNPNGTAGSAGSGGGGGGGGGGGYQADVFGPGVGQFYGGGGGGGVGILGTGSNGSGGAGGSAAGGNGGGGGSSGSSGSNASGDGGPGGAYGGGAGGPGLNENTSAPGANANGAVGAVRIIWGSGRSYPSNAANV